VRELSFIAYRTYTAPKPAAPQETELYRRIQQDFQYVSGGIAPETEIVEFPNGPKVTVSAWVRSDLISMGKFLILYVPETFDMLGVPPPEIGFRLPRQTYETIKMLVDRFPAIIARAGARGNAGLGDIGRENWRYASETIFTGAIYAYYEGDLTEAERVELRKIYKDHGAKIYFRDRRYMVESRRPPS
jgi:hypothetical protein